MRMSLPGRIAAYAAMYLVGIVILVPVLWLLVMSVSSTRDLTTLPLAWIPSELDFSRYTRLLTISSNGDGAAFLAALRNTGLVALGTTVLAFLLAIPAAWVFSRYPKPYSWMLYLIVATYMLP
ncbi:MAG TPA: carbohydrate ABC transporter permease, partial [Inquilinus sp.]|nr:carbohydrate ABC transporter permease [Inquilinus sp.]